MPDNGLDRSLHAPVLIGLFILTFFTETLGWTYAGLVVAGYLATVFIAAPVTGVLVAIEAVLTYLLVAGLGRWLTRTGAWSDVFGRERFFLFILGAIVVRLAVEGGLVPWLDARLGLPHARELYSLGLVLVPLLANMFWNSGLALAAPRVAVVTGLTWAVITFVLLPYTNFTVSRFQIANESVSLAFLESPHAHIILLVGSLIGARNNVRYGWDYSGILVPALLGVAWYQPTKLATTVVEALVVYGLSRALCSVRPLSRAQIVGPRRTLVAYSVGFAVKMILGFGLGSALPAVQMVDYFGFGYLLPTLLAVKMWNRSSVGTVIMPTLQVSLTAFLLGNAAGFGLHALTEGVEESAVYDEGLRKGGPVAFELLLADGAPRPRGRPGDDDAILATRRIAAEVAEHEAPSARALAIARRAGLDVRRDRDWIVVGPEPPEPDEEGLAPRAAFRRHGDWLVVASGRTAASPVAFAAQVVADRVGARAIVLRSHLPELRRMDEAFAEGLGLERALRIDETAGDRTILEVVGDVPTGLDVVGLGRALGVDLEVSWRSASGGSRWRLDDAPTLRMSRAHAEQIGARVLAAPEPLRWTGGLRSELRAHLDELTSSGHAGHRIPTIGELRLFSGVVAPELLGLRAGSLPRPWPRAVAARLGYRFVRVRDDAWGIVEPAGEGRRGNASWFVRTAGSGIDEVGVEVATPRWETGTAAAGMALYEAIGASMVLVSGAQPGDHPLGLADVRRTTARRSFFQRAHELWLASGGAVAAVHGIAHERAVPGDDVVLSFGRELPGIDRVPAWALPLARHLERAGLSVRTFDGSAARAPFEGSAFVAMAHAMRFAPDRMVLVWLPPAVRERFLRGDADAELAVRLGRLQAPLTELDVAARALALVRDRHAPHCDVAAEAELFAMYSLEGNPYDLRAALLAGGGCVREIGRDRVSGQPWAIVGGTGQARLVPLVAGPSRAIRGEAPILKAPAEIMAAVQLGLGPVEVELP